MCLNFVFAFWIRSLSSLLIRMSEWPPCYAFWWLNYSVAIAFENQEKGSEEQHTTEVTCSACDMEPVDKSEYFINCRWHTIFLYTMAWWLFFFFLTFRPWNVMWSGPHIGIYSLEVDSLPYYLKLWTWIIILSQLYKFWRKQKKSISWWMILLFRQAVEYLVQYVFCFLLTEIIFVNSWSTLRKHLVILLLTIRKIPVFEFNTFLYVSLFFFAWWIYFNIDYDGYSVMWNAPQLLFKLWHLLETHILGIARRK